MKLKIPALIISLCTLIFLGLIYGWSIFVVPLEEEFGWSRSETSLTFTISIMSMCLALMIGGMFNGKKDKPLISLVISAALIAAGFMLTSRAGSLLAFYIFYGVFCGAGVGFAYVEIISAISKWFPKKLGLISGAMMMAFGMGAMILGTACTSVIAGAGWRVAFVLLGVIMSVLLVISGFMIRIANMNQEKITEPEKGSIDEANTAGGSDLGPAEVIRTLDFWILFFFCMVLSASGLALMGHIAPCVMELGASAQVAALVAGVTSFANGLGRVVYGTCHDQIGIRKTLTISSVIFFASTIITVAGIKTGLLPVLIAGCFLLGLSFGAAPSTSSAAVSRMFGNRYFSANFGIISMQLILAAFIGPYLGGIVYTATQSYVVTFSCFIVFGIIAVAFALIMRKRPLTLK